MPATAGKGSNLGESFEYSVLEPVSLPRFKSALLPILNEPIELERISLYTKEVLESHPLKGLRLKNISKQFIAQGPVTVFEGDTVAGQARLADVKPGETRLLSYAIDLDVAMSATGSQADTKTLSVKIVAGEIVAVERYQSTNSYAATNKGAEPRTVWITQAAKKEWKLLAPAKAVERTADLQRFELKVLSGFTGKLDVVEENDALVVSTFASKSEDQLNKILKMDLISPAVKAGIVKVMAAMKAPKETADAIAEEESALKTINEAQARMRSNLAVTPAGSDVYSRYLKKFDDQEVEIEKRQARIKELTKTKEKLAKELKEMLGALNAE